MSNKIYIVKNERRAMRKKTELEQRNPSKRLKEYNNKQIKPTLKNIWPCQF